MGDRVSVLSQGRLVGRDQPGGAALVDATRSSRSGSSRLMFGADAHGGGRRRGARRRGRSGTRRVARSSGEPALELEDVTVAPGPGEIGAYDVTLEVRRGEIMGVAGVDGNGQRELAEAIAGQRSVSPATSVSSDTRSRSLKVAQREKLGLRYVTDDRLARGHSRRRCRWR